MALIRSCFNGVWDALRPVRPPRKPLTVPARLSLADGDITFVRALVQYAALGAIPVCLSLLVLLTPGPNLIALLFSLSQLQWSLRPLPLSP